jgi:hypothetical protein
MDCIDLTGILGLNSTHGCQDRPMPALPFASTSPGAAAAPWLAYLLDACVVLVTAGAWNMGYGSGPAAMIAAWGTAGVAAVAALAVAVALAYAAVRRAFIDLCRHMIDRQLEVDRLVATFRALRFPPERHYDDLSNYLSRVLHDPASVPLARRFAAQALTETSAEGTRSWLAAASRASVLDAAVIRYLADEAVRPDRVHVRLAANA